MSPNAHSATPSRLRPAGESETIHTNIPARLDRLPWSRFHLLMVIALGVTWILDGSLSLLMIRLSRRKLRLPT
jgi:hypothetical protein